MDQNIVSRYWLNIFMDWKFVKSLFKNECIRHQIYFMAVTMFLQIILNLMSKNTFSNILMDGPKPQTHSICATHMGHNKYSRNYSIDTSWRGPITLGKH